MGALPSRQAGHGLASGSRDAQRTLGAAERLEVVPRSQAVLGAAINYGGLLGWVAVRGDIDWAVVAPLYGGAWLWTLHYDTVYAHQDKRDDAAAGVRSTALRLGDSTLPALTLFSTGAIGGLAGAGAGAGLGAAGSLGGYVYFCGLAAAGGHLVWQLRTVRLDSPPDCLRIFQSNRDFGALVFGAIVAAQLLRGAGEEGGKGEDAEGVGAEGDAENADRRGSRARERHLTGFDVLRSLWCGEADIASRVRRAVGFAAERGGES